MRDYLDARLEHSLARLQRRPSLVAVDELARLGEAAFVGPDASTTQAAVDCVADRAAVVALGMKARDPAIENEHDLTVDRELLKTFTIDVVKAFRGYADATASLVVTREAKVHATAADIVTQNGNGARSGTHRRGIAVTEYCGVWEEGAAYGAGAMVTDRGALWFAQASSTTGRPGTSHDWKLMHKSLEKAGR